MFKPKNKDNKSKKGEEINIQGTSLGVISELSTKNDLACQVLITIFNQKKTPKLKDFKKLVSQAAKLMRAEPNVVHTTSPVHIIGDLHGSWADFSHILTRLGVSTPNNRLVFLGANFHIRALNCAPFSCDKHGDYVDRGPDGVEIVAALCAFKLLYPSQVILLRGNHESTQVNDTYGFSLELQVKFGAGDETLELRTFIADVDIIAYNQIFCVHGGPPGRRTKTIGILNYSRAIPNVLSYGEIANLLWSDPDEEDIGWSESSRGAGSLFGADITRRWLSNNQLKLIIRAHQLVNEGAWWAHDDQVLTLFSASFYDGKDNKGAVLSLPNKNVITRQDIEPYIYRYWVTRRRSGNKAYEGAILVDSKLFNPYLIRPCTPQYFR